MTPIESVLREFRASAIPDGLTRSNVRWVEGDAAIEIMTEQAIAKVQKVDSYITKPALRILERYQFAAAGGWVVYGCTVDGNYLGEVPYFKPVEPRKQLQDGKLKTVKYETPQGCQATPILPWVDEVTAAAIYERHGVKPLVGETFWQVVYRCDLPIVITEGLKKALSLIAHGLPAIALRGVACWHLKGSNELHQAIAQFAAPGRSVYVIFDQDEKLSTQINVRRQVLKLSAILEEMGCKVFIPTWEGSSGKGIDDALLSRGVDAQSWLNDLLQYTPTLNDYKRLGRVAAALNAIARLNKLSYPIERETSGEYLPPLPELAIGAIHVVDADMNAGKTTRIGADWAKWAKAQGWNILVLSPLNALGQQTAKDWEFPHIHNFGTSADEQQALWAMVSASHGVVMCPDSLHRIPQWFWSRPTLLILDESNQVDDHIAQGNTLGSRWEDILERFSAIAHQASQIGAVVLSEAGIPDRAVKFIQTITGCERVRVFKHTKQGKPWNCTVFSGQASGFRSRLLQSVGEGDRLLIVTSSQREARRLQKALAKRTPDRKVSRIDSETNQQGAFSDFFDNPDHWLRKNQPDVLILSPSAKSGVSIQGGISLEDAYFSAVWGYFPALATDTHMQLLGRYRPSVPRFIFVPPFISTDGDESLFTPRAVKRRLNNNLKGIAGVYGLHELIEADDTRAESLVRIETAVLDYLAASKTVSGAQKSIAHDALVKELEMAGHTVQCVQSGKDSETVGLWKQVQEEIWQEDAAAIASARVEERHTLKWAHKALDSLEAGLETRILAQKVIWREQFTGVMFDDAEECYQSLCKDYGAMRRGVTLQAKAENLEAAREGDRASVEAILKSRIRAVHHLPKSYLTALLIAKTGVLELLNGQSYGNSDPRAIAVKKAALHWANEIDYWLRLQIKPEQTPIEICNKLIKRLGLGSEAIARPGKRTEKRDQVWSVTGIDDPIRMRLLEAFRRKPSSSVSSICIDQKPLLQINDTTPKSLPDQVVREGGIYRRCGSIGDWLVESIEGTTARVRQSTGYASGMVFEAPIAELRLVERAIA